MRTLIKWLQVWTDKTCPDCQEAIHRLQAMSKPTGETNRFEGFILTIRKEKNEVPTIHIGRHNRG